MIRAIFLLVSLLFAFPSMAQPVTDTPAATPNFADLAEKLLPSVVNISTTQKVSASADGAEELLDQMPQFPPGSPFEEFFKDFKEKHRQMPKSQRVNSLGSGFIIDPSGLVVTNFHVVQNADQIKVILHDDTNLTARVIGRDQKTDLALLKVDSPKPLPAVNWGDSDKTRVGDWVLAIGNPFGLGGTVTKGIISARARDINSGPYDDYLQTDASINRGNSGGPMFNLQGQVIGVNSAIFSPTGGSVGIGFAIPAAIAQNVITQLKENGSIKRGWLGVRIQSVTEEIAKSFGLDKARGALVSSVTPNSPAAAAKIQQGDIILSVNGREIAEMRRLPRLVAEIPVGQEIELKIWRKEREINLKAKIAELKQSEEELQSEVPSPDQDTPAVVASASALGMTVSVVTPALRERFELNEKATGLVITAVNADSTAAEKGVGPGDLLVEINQEKISSLADFKRATGRTNAKPLLLLLERQGELRFVALPTK